MHYSQWGRTARSWSNLPRKLQPIDGNKWLVWWTVTPIIHHQLSQNHSEKKTRKPSTNFMHQPTIMQPSTDQLWTNHSPTSNHQLTPWPMIISLLVDGEFHDGLAQWGRNGPCARIWVVYVYTLYHGPVAPSNGPYISIDQTWKERYKSRAQIYDIYIYIDICTYIYNIYIHIHIQFRKSWSRWYLAENHGSHAMGHSFRSCRS